MALYPAICLADLSAELFTQLLTCFVQNIYYHFCKGRCTLFEPSYQAQTEGKQTLWHTVDMFYEPAGSLEQNSFLPDVQA